MDDFSIHRLERLVIIDGDCSFCNGFTRLSIALLATDKIGFVSSGSTIGQRLLRYLKLPGEPSTVYVIRQGSILGKSSAIFDLCEGFRRPYRWFRVFTVLPRGFCDWIYDLVAGVRRRLPGKHLIRRTLTPDQQKYLLDDDQCDWAELETLLKTWTISDIL